MNSASQSSLNLVRFLCNLCPRIFVNSFKCPYHSCHIFFHHKVQLFDLVMCGKNHQVICGSVLSRKIYKVYFPFCRITKRNNTDCSLQQTPCRNKPGMSFSFKFFLYFFFLFQSLYPLEHYRDIRTDRGMTYFSLEYAFFACTFCFPIQIM